MATKTYTAQELREESDTLDEFCRVFEKKSRTPAMLRYAAEVVEENAQLKARLEAVVKMASESRISREVKNIGIRLYVEIDDFKMDLDMGDVVKSLNSIDAILRAAYGEGVSK